MIDRGLHREGQRRGRSPLCTPLYYVLTRRRGAEVFSQIYKTLPA